MNLMQELPMQDLEEYAEFSSDVLSSKLILDRKNEIVVKFSPEDIINKIDELLKLKNWLEYEKKSLEVLKEILKKAKHKGSFKLTKIKINDFIKFSKFGFEANLERANWVKDKVVVATIEKKYNEYVSQILFVINQNTLLLLKIKDLEPKNEHEAVKEVRRIIKFGPKIQINIYYAYVLIINKPNEKEILDKILNETLECINEYHSIEEII